MGFTESETISRREFTVEPYLPAFPQTLRYGIATSLNRLLGLTELTRRYHALPGGTDLTTFVDNALHELGVTLAVTDREIDAIPRVGPCIVVVNHPHGGIDGLLLMKLLLAARPDVRFIANHFLSAFRELESLFLQVDPFQNESSRRFNVAATREALRWLRGGGMLVIFPGGEVSSLSLRRRQVVDREWQTGVARMLKSSGAAALPLHINGRNSAAFQVAGLVHPLLRTALLPREMIRLDGRSVRIRVGKAVPASVIESLGSPRDVVEYLRLRTYMLPVDRDSSVEPARRPARISSGDAALAPEIPVALVRAEVEALAGSNTILCSGTQRVIAAEAERIPNALLELGRLREMSFRSVGEGTGQPRDLDAFDAHYEHLFVWDHASDQIVGGYRLARTDQVLRRFGRRGLYTNSLFHLSPNLLREMSSSIELGRSFVRLEQQRSHSALMLLWRGISEYVLRNPDYRFLFGPVSISNDYHPMSQQLMVEFLRRHKFSRTHALEVRPRRPFRADRQRVVEIDPQLNVDMRMLGDLLNTLEGDKKGLPVLLRQYLKIGGRILGFNIDKNFSNVVDCLLVVDLLHADQQALSRYFGVDGMRGYLEYHGIAHQLEPRPLSAAS